MCSRKLECCGLLNGASNKPVPLKSIAVDVDFKGFVADVVSTLVYTNEEENPVEAIFIFPMDADAAVYKFEATVDGKTIIAEIQEKQKARDTYDDAISSGQEAFFLEQDESSSDIFTCIVGNLPPKKEATVGLAFVMELPLEADGAVRFVLPGVLNPRYTPQDFEQGHVTQNVPRVPVSEVPYKLELKARIQYPHGITKVESNSAITPLHYLTSDKTSANVSLEKGHQFNKDLELMIYYSDVHKPSICLESGIETAKAGTLMGDAALMLNFYPSFPESISQSNMQEFIFVVDCSGSMDCQVSSKSGAPTRISSAKESLLFLLKSLPLGCYFNIYGFGSHYEAFFPKSREYTQDSMQEALEKVKNMDANFGGTEILHPLQDIYKKTCVPGHLRQVFVFTDGEVDNIKQVISLVKRNASKHRCFSFGIGEGASTALVKGIAKAAFGTAEFITGNERMQPKIMRSLKLALQSSVKDIAVNWQLPSDVGVTLLSKAPVMMFRDQRCIIYAQLKGTLDAKAEGHASVEYTFEDKKVKENLQFSLQPDRNSRFTVHHLAAKKVIAELDEDSRENSNYVKKVTAISLQAGIISSHTAFVAVNKELNQTIRGPLIRRDIPLIASGLSGIMVPNSAVFTPMACVAPMVMYDVPSPKLHVDEMYVCSASLPQDEMNLCSASFPRDVDFEEDIEEEEEEEKEEERELTSPIDDSEEEGKRGGRELSSLIVKLIYLQNANGSWKLDEEFATVMKLSEQELSKKIPHKEIDSSVWATVLAIVWLHEFGAEQKDEWELLVEKALTWVKALAGSNLKACSTAASDLLKTSFKLDIFGV